MRGAKQTEMFEILRRREILHLWSVCPPCRCVCVLGRGGGTLIFSYIRWPGLFFRVQNFEFQYFWGKKILWIFFGIITKLDYQGTDWRIFFGLLKFQIFIGVLEMPDFFCVGGGER